MSDEDTLPRFALLSMASGLACLAILLLLVIFRPGLYAVDLVVIIGLLIVCPLIFARMEGRSKPEPPAVEGNSPPNS